jgi:hypothetical protein
MDPAVSMDAKNAPTETWKTAENAVSHSAHTHHRHRGRKIEELAFKLRPTHEITDTPLQKSRSNNIGDVAAIA